uniref:Uncharacterized protein n=1 Tax=Podoviridae sp. ctsNK10 TaxID=2826582 RepID=A0A8S5NLH4_9CAUD|nr:MAG TPA: hypothetical protein [Podoviridae sp. ctsNK10]
MIFQFCFQIYQSLLQNIHLYKNLFLFLDSQINNHLQALLILRAFV